MPSILALSVTDKIEQYGAYAGFAAVLGLAILSLLYFAQAREVKRLREWAGRSPERAAEQQGTVAAASPRSVVAQPQAKPAAGSPAPVGAATPAGVAAQGAATAAAAAATAAGVAASTSPAGPVPPGPSQQPTTVQPAASPGNGSAPSTGGAGPVAPPPARPGEPLRMPSATPTPTPAPAPTPVPATARAQAAAAAAERGDRGRGRPLLPVLAAAAAVAAVLVVLVVVVFGGGGGGKNADKPNQIAPAPTSDGTSTSASRTASPAVPRSQTRVAVLNGTTIPGLARGVGNKLQQDGWKLGNVTNATDQTRSATLVLYAPGHKAQALDVAKAIGLGSDVVGQVDSGNRLIAGDEAAVVVVVGADQQPQ